ncbi:MAG TPA: hypothetical protein DFR83_23085, partial [Deltaproteobacteria bacterium]|nr:hypothetical protein [Deltaproteobacteria bacterium]
MAVGAVWYAGVDGAVLSAQLGTACRAGRHASLALAVASFSLPHRHAMSCRIALIAALLLACRPDCPQGSVRFEDGLCHLLPTAPGSGGASDTGTAAGPHEPAR